MAHRRLPVLLCLPLLLAACHQPSRMVTVASSPDLLEGQTAQVVITVRNVLSQTIIPVSMTVYERRDPTEQFGQRQILGEREFLAPLQCAKVRHLSTLNRVEADQLRDGGAWRRVPDTRFLHPRILLPGQSFAEPFAFRTSAAHRNRLYCDLFYFRLDGDEVRGRLYQRAPEQTRKLDDDHYTDVYTLRTAAQLADPAPQPAGYLLFRRRVPSPRGTHVVTKRLPLDVRPRPFSLRQALARARYAPRAHLYFTPADAWILDYDHGTWALTSKATVKLRGHYITLLADLEHQGAHSLELSAPRRPGDKLLDLFQHSGHADPAAKGDTVHAAILVGQLLAVLHQAETLGYLIDAASWRPVTPSP